LTAFGFTVRHYVDAYDSGCDGDFWRVELPQQHEEWSVTTKYDDDDVHATAVARLEQFIAEAGVALAALRERREHGVDGYGGQPRLVPV
jgi:hypothetical protein